MKTRKNNSNFLNRTRKSKDILVDKINDIYEKALNNNGSHLFFRSRKWWDWSLENWNKEADKFNDKKMIYKPNNIDEIKTIEGCVYSPKEIVSKKYLIDTYNLVNDEKITNFTTIRDRLKELFNYNLPSTVKDIHKYLQEVKDSKDTLNVLVVGGGPVGLFTALYIDYYYNKLMMGTGFNNHIFKKVNVLLLDNRIYKEGIKKPYSRVTQFGYDIINLQPFINQIFCWNMTKNYETRKFDYIHVLETLMYVVAYGKNIPMYFTKEYETFDKVEELCNNNNFNYIFDCTGGRLKTTFKDKLFWKNINFKEDNLEVKLDPDNYFRLYVDNKVDYQPLLILYMYDNDMKQIPSGTKNFTENIENKKDLELINKFVNKCFEIDEYKKLSYNFEEKNVRNQLSYILHEEKLTNVKYVKPIIFSASPRHNAFCAKKINKSLTYFAIGDTLGNTEFGIHFGMKHSILLSRHIIHLLGSY
jgi:hypothetical protein